MTRVDTKKGLLRRLAPVAALLVAAAPVAAFAQGAQPAEPSQQQEPQKPAKAKHHSKLKGAVVGGAGGAVVGGKKGAAVGAGAGALYQHHKNKKEAKEQQKQ